MEDRKIESGRQRDSLPKGKKDTRMRVSRTKQNRVGPMVPHGGVRSWVPPGTEKSGVTCQITHGPLTGARGMRLETMRTSNEFEADLPYGPSACKDLITNTG